jgi:hypothetical protein
MNTTAGTRYMKSDSNPNRRVPWFAPALFVGVMTLLLGAV